MRKLTRQQVQKIVKLARQAGKHPDLREVDLSGLNLSKLNLQGAILCKSDLSGANLSGADLNGADLSEAKLTQTLIDETTKIETKWLLLWKEQNNNFSAAEMMGDTPDEIDLTAMNLIMSPLMAIEEHTPPEKLRLDVAVPNEVQVNRPFDLAVALRKIDSAILVEADLPTVKSGDVRVTWPKDNNYVRLQIEIKSPNCTIEGENKKNIRLFLGEDSPVFYFQLTPKQIGKISIIVSIYQEGDLTGDARVQTMAQSSAGQVEMTITSQPMTNEGLPPALYSQLQETFLNCGNFDSDNELKAIFVDNRIHPWQHQIPQANNSADRASQIINYLYTQYRGDTGENALALFTQVLSQQHDPATLCHVQLTHLANELERKLSKKSPT